MTSFWDDFFRDMLNNQTNNPYGFNSSYSNHYIPRNKSQGSIGRLAQTLREVKELIEALLNNKLPSSHIVEESLAIDENQFNLNLVVEKQIGDETRRFNISVEEVIPQDEDDEDDESDEDTTSYFTE
jgi:hypothetical protein|tara:strand:+ start:7972 stop:8352 length:381 start_codon:yes stop_codon:yes gene_type:complete